MIIKPLKNRGRGSPKSVLKYLLDKPEGQMRVMKGDPKLSQKIAESLSYQQSYEAWVLSFEEQGVDIADEVKREIMDEFEKSFLPYFQDDPDRYNITWIEHTDKNGRLELNFFFPKVDLKMEKQISLFNKSSKEDWALINNFRDYINDRYQLSNPLDPEKARLGKTSDSLYKFKSDKSKSNKETADEIIQFAINEVARNKSIKSRDDLIEIFKGLGFEITRISKNSISIKNPNNPKGQNLKFKGEIFNVNAYGTNETSSSKFGTGTLDSFTGTNRGNLRLNESENGELVQSSSEATGSAYSDFRKNLDESIGYRRKMQQRAFDEFSGLGRAFGKFKGKGAEFINADERGNREHVTNAHKLEQTNRRTIGSSLPVREYGKHDDTSSNRLESAIGSQPENHENVDGNDPKNQRDVGISKRILEIPLYRFDDSNFCNFYFSNNQLSDREKRKRKRVSNVTEPNVGILPSVTGKSETGDRTAEIITAESQYRAREIQSVTSPIRGVESENISTGNVQIDRGGNFSLSSRGRDLHEGHSGQFISHNERIRRESLSGIYEVNHVSNNENTQREIGSDFRSARERLNGLRETFRIAKGNADEYQRIHIENRQFGNENSRNRQPEYTNKRNQWQYEWIAEYLANESAAYTISTKFREFLSDVKRISEIIAEESKRLIEYFRAQIEHENAEKERKLAEQKHQQSSVPPKPSSPMKMKM